MILATGANVIMTTKGIDDLCLKLFVEAGAMGVRRVKKEDMKRIARATGGTFYLCPFFKHLSFDLIFFTLQLCNNNIKLR